MKTRVYNLIYAIFSKLYGHDIRYENANKEKYESYAMAMLEEILEDYTN